MMLLRRAGIAALFLVAWAATADAECAWVLWKQFEVKTSAPTEPSWSIPHAAETRVHALARLWQSEVKGNQPDQKSQRLREHSPVLAS